MSRSFATLLILLVLVALAFFPQRISAAPGFFAASLLVAAAIAVRVRPSPAGGTPLGLQFAVFLLLAAGSVFLSPYLMRSWTRLTVLLTGFLMFQLAWRAVRDVDLLERLQWALAAVALAVALYSLVNQWAHPPEQLAAEYLSSGPGDPEMVEDVLYTLGTERIRGPFGNPNHLAGFLVACCAPLLLLAMRSGERKRRLLGLAGSLPILYVILLTQSRSGLLTLALSFIILALGAFSEFRKNIFHWKLSPLKVFALVAILIVLAFTFAESWVVLSRVGTIKTRIEYYSIAMRLIARAPLLGHGLDTFALYYPQFHQLGRGEAQYIHNWPLEVWFEMGLIGLAAFGWWIASVYRVFNHALNAAQDRREESALLVLMSGASAILLQSLFDFSNDIPALFVLFCFFLGCLAGRVAGREEQSGAASGFWSRLLVRWVSIGLLAAFWLGGLALPYYAASQHELGLALARSGEDPLLVIPRLENAVRLNPQDAEYRDSLGSHYLSLNQPRRAAEHFEAAIRLNPLKPRNHFNLYRALRAAGESERALAELKEAYRLHPSEDEYLVELARWYEARGERAEAEKYWRQAEETLTRAIESNPKAAYHRRLAGVLEALGRGEEARKHLRAAEETMAGILGNLE